MTNASTRRPLAGIGLAAATLLVGACRSAPPSKPPPAPTPAPQVLSIEGRALDDGRVALAPGATLEVQLIDDRAADASPPRAAPPATIMRRSFGGLHGLPFEFELVIAPATIAAVASCSLRATVRDAQGHLRFMTPARVPVTPGRRVELRLVRAGAN